ncbi:MFS transporter [Fictibacillus aquaticus]|uniref:MFS transporter n=1 Tax=Fictibacillus aquaticus TaxID=2021314 RepID=A0A235FC04_9BACL|nr:MFS transporter [Fictibacillus aquaticus]OYD58729.1 MFS transporter [Fictibacillus aquaticus]
MDPHLAASAAPRKKTALYLSLPVMSWALYDFANTIFSSNIITIFFPFYLSSVVGGSGQMDQIASTIISYANAAVSILLVLLSPLYGVWIDQTGKKKKYVVTFAAGAILSTLLMSIFAQFSSSETFFSLPASVFLVILAFMAGKFFYQSSLVFYDAMLPDVSTKENLSLLSGFGVAVGYTGTILGLSVYFLTGKDNFSDAFLYSGVLFLLFSLPIMFIYREKQPSGLQPASKSGVFSGYREIAATFKEIRAFRDLFLFMLAYFFFNDAIATAIAMMAPYATSVIGFSQGTFILLYLTATVFSIIGSFSFGHYTKKAGSKMALYMVGFLLVVALLLAVFTTVASLFWISGALYGIAMGAMWVVTRTMIVEMSPPEKRGQFFGLFAFSGKVSAVAGPLVYGTITLTFSSYGDIASRLALGSMLIFVAIGMIILKYVNYGPFRQQHM